MKFSFGLGGVCDVCVLLFVVNVSVCVNDSVCDDIFDLFNWSMFDCSVRVGVLLVYSVLCHLQLISEYEAVCASAVCCLFGCLLEF